MNAAQPAAASTDGERRRVRLPSRISIQSKLMLILLVTSITSVAIVGFVEFQSGAAELRQVVSKQLVQLRETQRRAVGNLFADLTNSLAVYSREVTAGEALAAFTAGFDELAAATITPEQQRALADYYRTDVIAPIAERTGRELDLDALLPVSPAQRYLQAHYTAAPGRGARPVAAAGDGSAWSAASARFGGYFAEIVNRGDLGDALLLDTRGNVVYSVAKGPDLGTNIVTGPYRESSLRDAYRKVIAANAVDFTWISDYQPYQPHLDAPAGWLVSPVAARGAIVGALALPLPDAKINAIMTVDRRWSEEGVGRTTETFLAGPDRLMRSDSRLFLQDPQAYRRKAVAAGTSAETADKALRLGSTVLVQPLDSPGLTAAQGGRTGTVNTGRDYLGQRELEAYAPLQIPNSDLQWSVLATRDHSDAYAGIASFSRRVVLTTVAIILAICVLAMLLAHAVLRPIHRLQAAAHRISRGDYDVAVLVRSRDEIGDLTAAFNDMSRSLQTNRKLLDDQRAENDRLLLALMPEPVLRRYRDGEQTVAEEHDGVAVVYGEVLGMDRVTADAPGDELVAAVGELFGQLDAAAETLGVERIRTMHNGYLAACGITTPRLDAVHRAVEFAVEMRGVVERFGTRTGHPLKLWVGVNAGAAISGLFGGSGVVYDLWGPAVDLTYRMRGAAPQPGIYVGRAVRDALPDTREFSPAEKVVVDGVEQPTWRLVQTP